MIQIFTIHRLFEIDIKSCTSLECKFYEDSFFSIKFSVNFELKNL